MSPSTSETDLEVQILHVPDCPNVAALRNLVERTLTALDLRIAVEEIEGPYPSPTLLVNGVDVNPNPDAVEEACRLDLPTEAQILGALTRGPRQPDGDGTQAPRTLDNMDLRNGD